MHVQILDPLISQIKEKNLDAITSMANILLGSPPRDYTCMVKDNIELRGFSLTKMIIMDSIGTLSVIYLKNE